MNLSVDLLVYAILIPVTAGIVCLFIPNKAKILSQLIALVITLVSMAASVLIFMRKPVYWPPTVNPTFFVDDLSALAGLGISFFAIIITIYSIGFVAKNNGRYFGYLLMTLGSSLGAVYSNNLIILVVFWGFLAALLYLMVSVNGGLGASFAAKKALIIIGSTDALMVFAIGLIWKMSGTFLMDGLRIDLNSPMSYMAYLCIAFAGFAKAGAVPLHSWLPDVAENGPIPVTAYLPASLDKLLSIYLLARASLSLFAMNIFSNTFLLFIGAVTVIFAVVMALVQHNFKRLLGYHAVSQVGYMLMGIGTATTVGIAGGLFHMLNNAVYKSCLLLSGGNVEKATGTADMSKLGGVAKYMPVTFGCFLVASLSISGIPPFNGFVSKWMVYQGMVELGAAKNPGWVIWLVAAMFGSALTIASFMKLLHAMFLGRPSKAVSVNAKETGLATLIPIIVLASICIVFGLGAFTIAIPVFLAPLLKSESIDYLGIWEPGVATGLILAGIFVGLLMYLSIRPKKARLVGVFTGGENPDSLDRVTGAEFYDTMRDIKALGRIYEGEQNNSLDLYSIGKRLIGWVAAILQKLHNGILPTYLVWCLLGMIVMFIILFLR
jgi:formate hydrogenlyase subunit 3/multisubunit Na+/H+ antiporter MnhD subunit